MNKSPKPSTEQLDEQLSAFADQVLSGKGETMMDATLGQTELAELQKTVLQMKAAAQSAHPSDEISARIRTRLVAEWKREEQFKRQGSKLFRWLWPLPRTALMGGLAIMSTLGIIIIFISTPISSSLTGTADGSSPWVLPAIVGGIVLIILLLWLDHHN